MESSDGDLPTLMAVTVVKSGREAEFEDFVVNVIVAAEQKVKPRQQGTWRLLRPADDQPEGATPAYMFLFYGDVPVDDWNLEPLFTEAYGPEEGARHLQRFEDLVEGNQSVHALNGEVSKI